jgi:transposase
MHATTVGVDLAKNHFELAIREGEGPGLRRERLTRQRFVRFFGNFPPSLIVMEACGSAHHWGRWLSAQGHQVWLLPAQYVRAYVRRNKTDAADAAALVEAARCAQLRPVPLKSIEQQQLQQLHRVREQLLRTRTARMNLLRGQLREFGVVVPVGLARGRAAIGEIERFPSGRHLASWLGLTAREHSSASSRRLGRISKQGDAHLRTWALATAQRCGPNKATVALANKLARIIWATWRHGRRFDGNWGETPLAA